MTTINQNDLERRAFARQPIRDSSAIVMTPGNIISFRLLNISKSGMAFSYNGKGLNAKLRDKAIIDLFAETISVEDLPIKIISDTEIDMNNVWFVSYDKDGKAKLPYLRRCGIEFDGLSDAQNLAIEEYIQSLEGKK